MGFSKEDLQIFLGIPFAEAPVGALRFHPPKPVEPWSGVREAKNFAAAPLQNGAKVAGSPGTFFDNAPISEDSLYLNVWAPKAPGPHPVFIWIYGGANISGSTNEPEYDGSHFARDGVVFVSIAYRVGAVGFLELGGVLGDEYRDSANNGLRDLVLGLQWVKNNISAFGGDPYQITIGGESAGAKNTAALIASPLAHGLFQQAILASGGGQTTGTMKEGHQITKAFLKAANIPTENAKKILSLSGEELLKAQNQVIAEYPQHFPFRALVGGEFLPQRPVDAVRAGATRSVPLLMSTCKDESAAFYPPHISTPLQANQIAHTNMATVTHAQALYAKQFPSWDNYTRTMRLLTAEEYWIPSLHLAEAQAEAGGSVWMYRFDRLAPDGWLEGYSGHGSDVAFIFDQANDHPQDKAIAAQVHELWVSFITKGQAQWPAYSPAHRTTELINQTPSVVDDPDGAERNLWNGLLK